MSLQLGGFAACHNRLLDESPGSNNLGSIEIGMFPMTTMKTFKHFLSLSVLFVCITTDTALSGSVHSRNYDNGNAFQCCLILDEPSQFIKSPTTNQGSERFAQPSASFLDALEVFKNNTGRSAFSLLNDPLADLVVDVSLESPFSSRHFLQSSLRGFCSSSLQRCSTLSVCSSDCLHSLSRILFPRGVRGKIVDTKIYTQKIICFDRRLLRGVDSSHQVEFFVDIDEIYLSFDSIHSCLLVTSEKDGEVLSASEYPKVDSIKSFEPEDTLVVDHCGVLFELAKFRSISLVRFHDFGNGSDDCLGSQVVLLFDSMIDKFLEFELGCCSVCSGYFGDVVTGFIEDFESLFEQLVLLFGGEKFDFYCSFHIDSLHHHSILVKCYLFWKGVAIPPTAKAEGFLTTNCIVKVIGVGRELA